jgi:SET domain-containing protein
MLEIKKSAIYGQGCFTTVTVNKRKKIGEYAGELLEGRRHIWRLVNKQAERGIIKVIWIGEDLAIDAEVGGNETAYINHSCEPNAFMRAAPVNRVLFFALRDISAGEEITIDYRDDEHPSAGDCRCGSTRCRSEE